MPDIPARVLTQRVELLFLGDVPCVAAFWIFSRSRVTVRLRLRRFLRESFSVFSKFFSAPLPPRPSSLRRSFSATSAASSDFSRRPIAFGPTTLRPRDFAAAMDLRVGDLVEIEPIDSHRLAVKKASPS